MARVGVLTKLAPLLSPDLVKDALDVALTIQAERLRAEALVALAPRLTLDLQGIALKEARSIGRGDPVEMLLALIPHLRSLERDMTLRESLGLVESAGFERMPDDALAPLPNRLAELGRPVEALKVARCLRSAIVRDGTLSALALRFTELGRSTEALAAAQEIGEPSAQARVLGDMALQWAKLGRSVEALQAVRAIRVTSAHAKALVAITDCLIALDQLSGVLRLVRTIADAKTRTEALAALVPHLAPPGRDPVLREAMHVAFSITDAWSRAGALVSLTPHLAPQDQDRAMREALAAAQTVESPRGRSDILAGLAPYLTPDLQREALKVTRSVYDLKARADALAALAPHLAKLPLKDLSDIWKSINYDFNNKLRADVVVEIASLFPVVVRLGGSAALVELKQAICDIFRWWK